MRSMLQECTASLMANCQPNPSRHAPLAQVANGNFIVGGGNNTCSYIYPAGFNK